MAFPIEEKYIIETEKQLNLQFPPIFKNKMIIENGGEIETDEDLWNLYPFFDKSDKKRISRTCNHIILETQNAKEWNNFPKNAIVIAGNETGDKLILIKTQNKLEEAIYIWYHDDGEIEKLFENIHELINNYR